MSHAQDFAQFKHKLSQKNLNNKIDWSTTNPKRIFDLIDSILPIQDCLSYQIIPLDLTERRLILGMVNPANTKALNYVRSHCSSQIDAMTSKHIDSKTHQLILSAYSRRSHTHQLAVSNSPSISQDRPTLIIDSPEEIKPKITEMANQSILQPVSQSESILDINRTQKSQATLDLELRPKYISAPPIFLSSLPPHLLWQELLARVLAGGNGRIHFERLSSNGRIFWSQNGNLKLSIDPLAGRTFQGVLDELKRLVNLPNVPVKQAYKGEIERSYQQERLLLLWHINSGQYGEEATVQILRGKVLALYQKRQMEELGEQAIKLAQQLERKLEQIRNCRRINPNNLSKLSTLRYLQEKINQQLKLLE